jgi:glycosyltransferase involved in cell wall biosynthesis
MRDRRTAVIRRKPGQNASHPTKTSGAFPNEGQEMSAVLEGYRLRPRTLAGATVLQIVPQSCGPVTSGSALAIARTLLHAGARVLVAGEAGPRTDAFQSAGAEWLPLATAVTNPLKLRRSVRTLEQIAAVERVDIVHAFAAGAAWLARMAAPRAPMWVVTSLPHATPGRTPGAYSFGGVLARGDRVIAASAFAARSWIERHRLIEDRIAVIPHPVDTARFDPSAIAPHRIDAVRHTWSIHPDDRAVLVPGRFAPENGQTVAIDAAYLLKKAGTGNVVFVLAGEANAQPTSVKALSKHARERGVAAQVRIVGLPRDLPAALAAAHAVAVPTLRAPTSAGMVAQAQAMGRPAIASDIGVLPETLLAPPRLAEELRTGWLVRPGDAASLAHALHCTLTLDPTRYQALAARARHFAKYLFAPERVAAATRAVYMSLLARDA